MASLKERYTQEIASMIEINYVTNNDCYKVGRKINPNGVVVHSIGVAQPSVDVIRNNFNKSGLEDCVNAVMNNERIILTMPYNYRPWGCGAGKKGSWNNTRFQFEICEPAGHKYNGGTMVNYNVANNTVWFNQMYTLLIKFLVYLCVKHGFNSSKIHCHSEAYKMGYGSNHSDVMQWFPKHGKSMNTVRADVQAVLDGTVYVTLAKKVATKLGLNSPDYWAECLDGSRVPNGKYIGVVIQKALALNGKTLDSWLSDPSYWTQVMNGKIAVNPNYLVALFNKI